MVWFTVLLLNDSSVFSHPAIQPKQKSVALQCLQNPQPTQSFVCAAAEGAIRVGIRA